MSDKQPETLRLAEHLERFRSFPDDQAAAAELRRLHAVNQELLEALKLALEYWRHRQQRYKNRSPVWVQAARAAITKATGEAT